MIVSAGAAAAAYLAYQRIAAGGRKAVGVAVALSIVAGVFALLWQLRNVGAPDVQTVELPSSEQPPAVALRPNAAVRTETQEDGLMLVIRPSSSDSPFLTARTVTSVWEGPSGEAHYLAAIGRLDATIEGGFRASSLTFAPNARGVAWRSSDRKVFAWIFDRAPGVHTVLQCVATPDGDPTQACAALLAAITLDASFRPRMEHVRAEDLTEHQRQYVRSGD